MWVIYTGQIIIRKRTSSGPLLETGKLCTYVLGTGRVNMEAGRACETNLPTRRTMQL